MHCSKLGFPVHHQLLELAQTHVCWVGDAIQPSHLLSSPCSCLQSFSASGSLPMSQFFASDGQRIGVSSSASALPMNTQDWFPWGLTGFISLPSKGLSRVFSNTTIQNNLLNLSCSLIIWTVSCYLSNSVILLLTVKSLGIFQIKISKASTWLVQPIFFRHDSFAPS